MIDLISRKAAIKAIRKDMYADKDYMSAMICEGIEDVLNGVPSAEPNEQIKWERDTAIQQLADLGYGLGEKPRRDDCISRKAAIDVASGYCHPANIADELRKLPSAEPEQTKMIKEIRKWINSGNRGSADYFIVDKIEEIINKYE